MTKSKTTHSRNPSNAYPFLDTEPLSSSSDSETSSPASKISKTSSAPSIQITDIHGQLSTMETELKLSLDKLILQCLDKLRPQVKGDKGKVSGEWEVGVDELLVSCRKEVDYHVHALAAELWEKRDQKEWSRLR